MQGPTEKIVLLPRFSSFMGQHSFITTPINVKRYATALLALQVDGYLGHSMPPVSFTLEESVDLQTWTSLQALTLNDVTEASFGFEWVRLVIDVPSNPDANGITCWCVGNFTPRDR